MNVFNLYYNYIERSRYYLRKKIIEKCDVSLFMNKRPISFTSINYVICVRCDFIKRFGPDSNILNDPLKATGHLTD